MSTTLKIIWFAGFISPIVLGWILAKLFGGCTDCSFDD